MPPPIVDEVVPAGASASSINAIPASPNADIVGFAGDVYRLAGP